MGNTSIGIIVGVLKYIVFLCDDDWLFLSPYFLQIHIKILKYRLHILRVYFKITRGRRVEADVDETKLIDYPRIGNAWTYSFMFAIIAQN